MTRELIADWAAARSDKWRRQLAGLEAMLAPIDASLIDALSLSSPMRIADVGCGSGATTMEIVRYAPEGSVVDGWDLSPALIEVARRRRRARCSTVAFEVSDMEKTLPPDPAYDRLVSRLGVMFFNDPVAAFTNLRTWLVPGGCFAFAVWGPLSDNPWMTATRDAVARVANVPQTAPGAPGAFRYADSTSLLTLLGRAGFEDVTSTDLRLHLPIGDRLNAQDAAQFALGAFSSFAELLAAAGGDAFDAARTALAAQFADFEQGNVVMMPARLHIVTGTR